MKMYILVREEIPLGFALVAAAHAGLAVYLKFKDTAEVGEWLSGPFFKVVCKVTNEEFESAKHVDDHVVLCESALGGQEVALAFKPRAEWPRSFKFYRLYKSERLLQSASLKDVAVPLIRRAIIKETFSWSRVEPILCLLESIRNRLSIPHDRFGFRQNGVDKMMSDSASKFVRGNHKLEWQMSSSPVFTQIKVKNSFVVDGQTEYIVAGDVSGTEEELYLDSLARGAQLAERKAEGESLNGDEILFWQLYTELPADMQALLQRRFK